MRSTLLFLSVIPFALLIPLAASAQNEPTVPEPIDPQVSGPEDPVVFDETPSCSGIKPHQVMEPVVHVISAKLIADGRSKQYSVSGHITGVCIVSAGYFEKGLLRTSIHIHPHPLPRRFPFDLRVRGDKIPELRVYNSAGERTTYMIERDLTPQGTSIKSIPRTTSSIPGTLPERSPSRRE